MLALFCGLPYELLLRHFPSFHIPAAARVPVGHPGETEGWADGTAARFGSASPPGSITAPSVSCSGGWRVLPFQVLPQAASEHFFTLQGPGVPDQGERTGAKCSLAQQPRVHGVGSYKAPYCAACETFEFELLCLLLFILPSFFFFFSWSICVELGMLFTNLKANQVWS